MFDIYSMTKKLFTVLASWILVVAIMGMTPAAAQNSGGGGVSLVIAVVDKNKVLRESEVAKSIRKQIDAKRKAFEQEAKAVRDKLKKEEAELKKKRTQLSGPDFEKAIRKFQDKVVSNDRDFREKAVELEKAYRKSIGQVDLALSDVVEEVAKNWGVTLVIRKDQAMYVNSSLDMTSLVMDELNKKMKTIKVFEK